MLWILLFHTHILPHTLIRTAILSVFSMSLQETRSWFSVALAVTHRGMIKHIISLPLSYCYV